MILRKEIDLISNSQLREAVNKCIKDRARKLKILPASTTGKYHPPDERGPGGLIKHIKRIAWFVEELNREFQLSEEDHDCLLVAALLHDISLTDLTKINEEGTVILDKQRYRDHPKLSALIAMKYLTAEGIEWDSPILIKIVDLISSHMSRWYPHCKSPFSHLEFMFCMADYFTSREKVSIKLD